MQTQSSSTAPAASPQQQPARTPSVVVKPTLKPKSRGPWWILGIVLLAAIAAGAYLWQKRAASTTSTAVSPGVRTARASVGRVNTSIRLTGVTAAENFASLITPQLRGSRGDRGRQGESQIASAGSLPQLSPAPANIGPRATGGGTGTGTGSSMSSAMRASTSRLGGSRAASSTAGGAAAGGGGAAGGAAGGSSMGSSGTGTTSGQLQGGGPGGGGGGGGGMGDFSTVLQKLVKPGSHVKKGDVVAELDRQYMMNRLDDYKASVIQTQASVLKLKAELTITRHAHRQSIERAKAALDKARLDLKTVPVLGNIDAERAKLAVEEMEARYKELLSEQKHVEVSLGSQLRNAEINLQQAQIELKRVEANADKMLLKAPIDGLTVMQTIPRGGELAQVQEGDQLFPGTMFMSIVDPRSMVVNALVNQADVEQLRIGASARVSFDAYPGLVLPAKVYSVGGLAKPGGARQSYVKEIPVRLKLEKVDPRVIPDLTVSADITVESESKDTVIAPVASVFRDNEAGKPYVFVQDATGWVRRDVELGLANHISVAVRSGLKDGEVVALDRPSALGEKASAQ